MWVFAYGSLLWNPGFTPIEEVRGTADGYRRSFCMWSIHHRGSEEDPGLVLALDEAAGEHCIGMALKVHPDEEESVLAALRERELISSAYVEHHIPVALDNGQTVHALAYVIEKKHVQYCQLPLERQAQIITHAVGGRGPNWEYLALTCARFETLGVTDTDLRWLNARVSELRSEPD